MLIHDYVAKLHFFLHGFIYYSQHSYQCEKLKTLLCICLQYAEMYAIKHIHQLGFTLPPKTMCV